VVGRRGPPDFDPLIRATGTQALYLLHFLKP